MLIEEIDTEVLRDGLTGDAIPEGFLRLMVRDENKGECLPVSKATLDGVPKTQRLVACQKLGKSGWKIYTVRQPSGAKIAFGKGGWVYGYWRNHFPAKPIPKVRLLFSISAKTASRYLPKKKSS